MCGRYSLIAKEKQIQKSLQLIEATSTQQQWNIAPTALVPIVTNQQKNEITQAHWGLVPSWADTFSLKGNTFNARIETLEEKPTFKDAINQRHCIIPASSYFEWQTNGKQKIPFRILPKSNELFVFAGIWDTWNKNGQTQYSFSVITTEAYPSLAKIHHRMPFMLDIQQGLAWINTMANAPISAKKDFLRNEKIKDTQLDCYTVSPLVNKVQNNTSAIIQPHQYAVQGSLF